MNAELLGEPFLYKLVRDFDLIPNVRRADVSKTEAWFVLELQGGSEDHIQEGVNYLTGFGAAVKPLQGDFVES